MCVCVLKFDQPLHISVFWRNPFAPARSMEQISFAIDGHIQGSCSTKKHLANKHGYWHRTWPIDRCSFLMKNALFKTYIHVNCLPNGWRIKLSDLSRPIPCWWEALSTQRLSIFPDPQHCDPWRSCSRSPVGLQPCDYDQQAVSKYCGKNGWNYYVGPHDAWIYCSF